jgi:HptB-dependent secretion and biofilm anti anti-sigma factor
VTHSGRLFQAEKQGDVLIVMPLESINTLESRRARVELTGLAAPLRDGQLRHVLVDLEKAPYFGTCMLELMHALWRHARASGGKMVLCNVSKTGREILSVAKLDALWPICPSLADGLDAVKKAD